MQGLRAAITSCAVWSAVGAAATVDELRPKYARVKGDIETVWQRPPGEPKGVLFVAHGCQHQGTDIFAERGSDGWDFRECRQSNLGRCLGLPEEVDLRRAARRRGYVVMAVSGGWGMKSCWDMYEDPQRVVEAIDHVLVAERLDKNSPVLATGASSGGAFMGALLAPALTHGLNVRCIVPQIMGIRTSRSDDHKVPVLFIHMPKDTRTASKVENNIRDLRARGVRAEEIRVKATPVTPQLLARAGLDNGQAAAVVEALRADGYVDVDGFLREDPRSSAWRGVVRRHVPSKQDSLVADESAISELLNVAWAKHEFVSGYTEELLDFCEAPQASAGTTTTEL
mmetsp:Transcript_99689/g.281433  ORF Transcript_99689/g.281433 Transcript_99689/m.281433 type:complete len:340 (+) Transcript_99689:81-1100(+)